MALIKCPECSIEIDAAQGVEAQTVANYHLAAKLNLKIIPVINRIDLGHAICLQLHEKLATSAPS